MKISRIYVTVDGVDYRLLGSELNLELDIRVRELILKSLLTSKINHIERDKRLAPPEASMMPENLVVKPKYFDEGREKEAENARKFQKLLRSHQLNFDRSGKAIAKDSGRFKLYREVARYFCFNENKWIRKANLVGEMSKTDGVSLAVGTIEIYLSDLHKAGFLTEQARENNTKFMKVSPSVMNYAEGGELISDRTERGAKYV